MLVFDIDLKNLSARRAVGLIGNQPCMMGFIGDQLAPPAHAKETKPQATDRFHPPKKQPQEENLPVKQKPKLTLVKS